MSALGSARALPRLVPSLRRWSRPMWVGVTLCMLVLGLAAFGPLLAPRDPAESLRIVQDRLGEWHTAPFGPLEVAGYPMGTDWDGRDLLSRLLWAFRPTVLMASGAMVARLILGVVVGTFAGWFAGRRGAAARLAVDVASAIPLLIVAVLVLFLTGGANRLWHFALALSVTGWAATAAIIHVRVRGIRDAPYIEAARALGAGEGFIVRRHVVPHVRTLIPILAAFEIGGSLLLLGELGFLGFYLNGGATRFVARADSAGAWAVSVAGTPELGQLLSGGWQNFYQTPWLALWGGAAFFLAVFAFMSLGEGLKRLIALP